MKNNIILTVLTCISVLSPGVILLAIFLKDRDLFAAAVIALFFSMLFARVR